MMKGTVHMLSSFIFIFLTIPTTSTTSCPIVDSCNTNTGLEIRFPFRLLNRQPVRCGYPGFDLYCNIHNQTILNLTESGEFIVQGIDYKKQTILINDPDSCLPNRLMNNVSLTGSPFKGNNMVDFTFLNCTYDRMEWDFALAPLTLQCFSRRNYTFMPKDSHQVLPAACRMMGNVSVPMRSTFSVSTSYWTTMGLLDDIELGWTEPNCGRCEEGGGTCGYLTDSGLELGCNFLHSRTGLPRIGLPLILVVGLPILLCLIILVSYSLKVAIVRSLVNSESGIHGTGLAVRSSTPNGLDGYTIESYPKNVLGASRRLPDPSNVTCSICLSDYQPQETLRTIPECNHYFHSDCIDDWLRLKGTCPLCRNLPKPSTVAMPCPMQTN